MRDRNFVKFILLLMLCGILRSISQTVVWVPPEQTWLPDWIYWVGSPVNIDVFHMADNGVWFIAMIAMSYYIKYMRTNAGIYIAFIDMVMGLSIAWVVIGLFMNIFYHIIWRHSQYWDWPIPFMQGN